MLWRSSAASLLTRLPPLSIPVSLLSASSRQAAQSWSTRELKHDGYRLQIPIRDGRVRLYTMNGADWSKRYPLIVAEAARLKASAILDAEGGLLGQRRVAGFLASCTAVASIRWRLPVHSTC